MPCYKPLKGYRSKTKNESGKHSITFNPRHGYIDLPLTIPCGQCIGCRLERSRQWAIRCVHEAQLYENNCFLTLTYDNQSLPKNGSLDKSHFQKFIKRLRKKYGKGIRYFHCGEYGEKFFRPHYHAIIFNHDFHDKQIFKKHNDNNLYISENLSKLWTYGFSTIGDVTFDSAAYVARYIVKKVTGQPAKEHYGDKLPEYTTMSRRPGIGQEWYKKFKTDVYPSDFITLKGKKIRPPKYYDNQYDRASPDLMEKLKGKRQKKLNKFTSNNTPERLEVRETIQLIKANQLIRRLEHEE